MRDQIIDESKRTRPDTQTGISCGGWAGAVMWRAGAVGSAVYMSASFTCDWAGAVVQKLLAKAKKKRRDQQTDRQTDTQTYRPTQ